MQQNKQIFLDLRRAAQEYPFSRRTLWQFIKNEQLQAFRVGGKLIIRRCDLERLLTSNPVGADLNRIVDATLAELGVGK